MDPRLALVACALCAGKLLFGLYACAQHERTGEAVITSSPANPPNVWTTSGGPASPGSPGMGDTVEATPVRDAGVDAH